MKTAHPLSERRNNMSAISCHKIIKRYGDTQVVHQFDLDVCDNEFVVFLGPSGCGKSTILRMLAGLEDISGGELLIGGTRVNDLPPQERGIAMVFQNYALYPHMSVRDNIAFGLKRLKVPKSEIARRVKEVSDTLGLERYLERRPTELSGGQQQRVAIARAMIKTPKVFLFDEPLSNLDAKLRNHMRVEIARLHQTLRTTTVYVTHDQHEAMTLADRIVLLRDGRIEQVGSPREIYENPRSAFVAGFIGTPPMNLLEMTVAHGDGGAVLRGHGGTVRVDARRFALEGRERVTLGIRPAHLLALPDDAGAFVGQVQLVEYLGNEVLVSIGDGPAARSPRWCIRRGAAARRARALRHRRDPAPPVRCADRRFAAARRGRSAALNTRSTLCKNLLHESPCPRESPRTRAARDRAAAAAGRPARREDPHAHRRCLRQRRPLLPARRHRPYVVDQPMILGHEASGTVAEVGSEVTHLRPGDRVCMEPGIPQLDSRAVREGIYNLDPAVRFWATPPIHGCLTPYVVHPAAFTFRLPDNVSFAEGAIVEPLAIGLQAAKKAALKPGDVAVVVGAGTIGAMTVLAALAGGAARVILADLVPEKLALFATTRP